MSDATKIISDILSERLLVLDGAMGTMLQRASLTAEDFGGSHYEGCNEHLVLTRPEVIRDIHRQYFLAGADIVETNTFGATPLVLAEYDLADQAFAINKQAALLAREAAREFSTAAQPRFVAGSMGPTTKAITVTGGVSFEQLIAYFLIQAQGLIAGGVDLFLLETCQDTRNIKAAVIGIHKALAEAGRRIPLIISGTIEPMGTMLAGQAADAFVASLAHLDLLALGLNCATGPEFMTDSIRTIHELAGPGVSCYPNAGLPDEEGHYLETPQSLAQKLACFVDNGWLNIVGGCCGTTPEHIRALADMVVGKRPRRSPGGSRHRSFYTGIELVEATADNRPLLVGERTNVIGSRKFKELVGEQKWDEASELARRQVKNGAQIVDVCLQSTDRDELPDMDPFYDSLIRKIKAPIMIDTTDPRAVDKALTYCQGKSIINSINLEDGEEKFEKIVPLMHRYGAAVVVGCIDEDPAQAQAFTRQRKLAVAQRSGKLLTEKYGVRPEDIIFDPLVFPCASGDANYIGGAVETIAGILLIKENIPDVRTILGISNVSFGLPPAAREVVNSVFLYHATKAGLDLAIVNSERLARFAKIPEGERRLTERLLFNHPNPEDPVDAMAPEDWREQSVAQRTRINRANIAALAACYRTARPKTATVSQEIMSLDERLERYIIDGSKDGLIADLDAKLRDGCQPLAIINGPLMAGMNEVGRLFNNNELIVAEVLQSAEAMKAAVGHLEQFMDQAETLAKGKIVLATVKGDVHDIGKNLVEIILKNNGYEVINLGIKVPPEALIKAFAEHRPDAIGLSGLLVKSAQQMVVTAADLRAAGVRIPLLVGGAALSQKFTHTKIAPSYQESVLYCQDAMTGLAVMNQLMDPERREALLARLPPAVVLVPQSQPQKLVLPITTTRSSRVRIDLPIPPVPGLMRHVAEIKNLDEVWGFINPQMLYVRHLGFKGNFEKKMRAHDRKAVELLAAVDAVKNLARGFMKIRVVWQFFAAESLGNDLSLFAPGCTTPVHTFHFLRQGKPDGLCLTDFVLPPKKNASRDHIAGFVVTAGEGVRQRAEAAKDQGAYLKSHVLQALAIETAEAAAEWLHQQIRTLWGFADPETMTMPDRFSARYRGKRYSFGYPACPRLEDQEGLWQLLRPEEIGVQLTEGLMMDPEASVSALVFHHPDCVYFGVGDGDGF